MLLSEPSTARRVLILMPTERDVQRSVAMLSETGLDTAVCRGIPELCRELRLGAGAVLVTDDSLLGDVTGQVAEALRAQPAWSNVPFVVIAHPGAVERVQRGVSETLANLTIVERPVRTHSLLSVLRSALRGRQHQYQIRDALLQHERQTQELQRQRERARFAMEAGALGSWELDLRTMQLECSDLCKSNFGRLTDQPFTYEDLRQSVHPEDQARVSAAIEHSLTTGADFDIEYRCRWPNGEIHWVMVRGRVAYDDAHRPLRMGGVSLDITERKRMYEALQQSESELVRQAEQLRAADRNKDAFLATLAHELRNPLAPIRTGMDLLTIHDASSQRAVEIIRRQLAHMVRLIDDLLDVSRITRGKLELKRERVRLADIVALAVEASQPLIERGEHTLRITLPAEPMVLDADLTRMAQVIGNVLNNASKYTPQRGTIELSATREALEVVIRVRDNGIGIPPDQLEHVFEIFSQVNRTLDRSRGGLGIGLALVRQLVEMHGGRVRASSAGAGAGTTLEIQLPLAAALAPEPETGTLTALGEPLAPNRVLVVDDNDDAAEMMAAALQRAGHHTLTVSDGPSALDAVESWQPHVVLLDIGLPGMSGYEVARALRRDPRHAGLALIALTGWGSQDDRRTAAHAGFDLHLTKPVDGVQLSEALASVSTRAHPSSAR